MDCSLPGSSIHGILQARILEWVAPLFQGIFPTQGSNLSFFCLLNWQAGSLLLAPPGKTIVPSIFFQALTSPFSYHGHESTALSPWALYKQGMALWPQQEYRWVNLVKDHSVAGCRTCFLAGQKEVPETPSFMFHPQTLCYGHIPTEQKGHL